MLLGLRGAMQMQGVISVQSYLIFLSICWKISSSVDTVASGTCFMFTFVNKYLLSTIFYPSLNLGPNNG